MDFLPNFFSPRLRQVALEDHLPELVGEAPLRDKTDSLTLSASSTGAKSGAIEYCATFDLAVLSDLRESFASLAVNALCLANLGHPPAVDADGIFVPWLCKIPPGAS